MKALLATLLLISVLLVSGVGYALTPPIIYVAGDGSGDFNCDGKDDHEQINAALSYLREHPEYTTVYLKGPFTYVISDTIVLYTNSRLTGDADASVKLAGNVGWPAHKAMFANKASLAIGPADTDIEIWGFEINGNRDENSQGIKSGAYYHNLFSVKYCKNMSIHDMYLHNNHNDGITFNTSDNLKFYNNNVYRLGHDVVYAYKSTNVEVYNNTVTIRTNCAFRMYNTNHASVHDNVITSLGEGGAGIQIQKESDAFPMDDVEIYNNDISSTVHPGIWVFARGNVYPKAQVTNLRIHNNKIRNCRGSGIVINGFYNALIENNVIDGCYGAGIVHKHSFAFPGSGYITIVRNNIITNTRPHESGGNGVAILNRLSDTHTFIIDNNCLYNNAGGNYQNASSTTDIYVDPLYADRAKADYHLKSMGGRWDGSTWVIDNQHSPCIDAGYADSDYSLEPSPNGGRINIGLYGNTAEASLSAPAK